MKRYVLYTVVFLALFGCTKDKQELPQPPEVTSDGQLVPIIYGVTRALGENAPPPPDSTEVFSFISYYHLSGTNYGDVYSYFPNPEYGSNREQGFYRYVPDDAGKWKGIMQPCSITGKNPSGTTNTIWYSEQRDPQMGQALQNGYYMTTCLRPAVELLNNGAGSMRILMTRTDKRYVSRPFAMNVLGYEIFPLPEPYDNANTIPMQDLRSKVWFEIIQGTDSAFTIPEPPQLINAGFWGWYHPLLQTTQISYEAGSRYYQNSANGYTNELHDEKLDQPGDDSAVTTPKTGRYSIYDRTDPYYQNTTSIEDLTVKPAPAPTDGTGTPDTFYGPATAGMDNIIYTTGLGFEQGIFFFSNKYRTRTDYLQPGIYFKLQMGQGADAGEFEINIPFDIDMEPNHAYLFRLTVESSVIRVHYRAAQWEGEYNNGGTVGNDPYNWTLLGLWSPEGWETVDMNGPGNYDIGNE